MVIPINGNNNPKETTYDWHMEIVQDNLRILKQPNDKAEPPLKRHSLIMPAS